MIQSSRVATTACYTSMFLLGVSVALIGAIARSIDLSPQQIGLFIAAQNVGFTASVLLSGALADTHSKPGLLLAGSLVLAAAFFSFYATDVFWLNLTIMAAIGAGIGSYEGVTDALLLDLHSDHPSYYINVNHFFVTFGSIVIALYLMLPSVHWRSAAIESGIVALALAALFAVLSVERSPREHEPYTKRLQILGGDRTIAAIFCAMALAVGVEAGSIGIMTTFLAELRAMPTGAAHAGLLVFLGGIAAGRLATGWLARDDHIMTTLIVLFGASFVLHGALYFLHLGLASHLLVFAAGLSMSAIVPLLLALAGRLHPDMTGTVLGTIKTAMPIGGIVLPFAMSMLATSVSFQVSLGLYPLAFLAGMGLLAAQAPEITDALTARSEQTPIE